MTPEQVYEELLQIKHNFTVGLAGDKGVLETTLKQVAAAHVALRAAESVIEASNLSADYRDVWAAWVSSIGVLVAIGEGELGRV